METRHPVEGSFGNECSSIYNHCGVMAAWSRKVFLRFLEKNDSSRENCQNSVQKGFIVSPITCCVQISGNLADRKSVKSCVKQKITKFRLALVHDRAQNLAGSVRPNQCTQSAPDFIQIGSLWAELYPNALESESNIRLKHSFEPNKRTDSRALRAEFCIVGIPHNTAK